MAYFPDLAPCTFFTIGVQGLQPPLPRAVGWLDADHAFPKGDPGKNIFEKLKVLRDMRWQPFMFMGGHECELCRFEGFYSHKDLFIPGDGVTYAVPEAILHYIDCHEYLPPQEFCESVMRCPPPDTPEFFAALRAAGFPSELARPDDEPPLEELRRQAVDAAIEARALAMTAALDAFRVIHGRYPDTLEEAEALIGNDLWTYVRQQDGSYRLEAAMSGELTLVHHSGLLR